MKQLVVGADHLPESRPALSWAADEAVRRELTLVVVTVIQPPTPPGAETNGGYEAKMDNERWRAEALLRSACAMLDGRGLSIQREVLVGTRPARVLIDRAQGSEGLVVGTRGLGRFAALLRGSISQKISLRPPCPIIVVPAGPDQQSERRATARDDVGRVMVGVDGSAPARVALSRAAEEARLRGAVLEVVTVRRPPDLPAEWSLPRVADDVVWVGTTPVAAPWLKQEAARMRQDAIARWWSAAGKLLDRQISGLVPSQRPARIERLVVTGTHPAQVLPRLASRADLLVVGSRGHGFTSRLFGSVSLACMRDASVPVMVVPRAHVVDLPRAESPARTAVVSDGHGG